eukprot:scaffold520_cov300-Pavlova_lutheri.AAC.4
MQTIIKLVLTIILLLVFLGVGGTMIYIFLTRNKDEGSPPSGTGSPVDTIAPPVDSSTCSEYATEDCEFVRALLAERVGFGRHTVGGLGGRIYHVTTLVDEGPGSLRHGLQQTEPLWIVFDVEGTIDVKTRMTCRSHKTVDGRGARVVIEGRGLLARYDHFILNDLEFRNYIDDAVSARNGQHGWIHRCKMGDTLHLHKDEADGVVDITHGFRDITVSWCYFYDHAKGFLVNGNFTQSSPSTNVTYHHNFFQKINTRIPMIQGGTETVQVRVHTFNNFRKNCSGLSGAAIDVRPQDSVVLIENDLFENSGSVGSNYSNENPQNIADGYAWKIQGCERRGGSSFPRDKDPQRVFTPEYKYTLENANDLEYLEHETGPR